MSLVLSDFSSKQSALILDMWPANVTTEKLQVKREEDMTQQLIRPGGGWVKVWLAQESLHGAAKITEMHQLFLG